jgi:hypothetical protein
MGVDVADVARLQPGRLRQRMQAMLPFWAGAVM